MFVFLCSAAELLLELRTNTYFTSKQNESLNIFFNTRIRNSYISKVNILPFEKMLFSKNIYTPCFVAMNYSHLVLTIKQYFLEILGFLKKTYFLYE